MAAEENIAERLASKLARAEAERLPQILERAFFPGNNPWAWYEAFKAMEPGSPEEFQAQMLRNPKRHERIFQKLGLATSSQRVSHLAWLFRADPAVREGWQEYAAGRGTQPGIPIPKRQP